MKSPFPGALALATTLAMVVGSGLASHRAIADDDEAITPDVVMHSLFAGRQAPLKVIKAEVESDSPDWAKIKQNAAKFPKYGSALGRNEPPQGDKDSWAKLTKILADESKAIDEAAAQEDREAVAAHVKAIGASCKSCHSVHRPD